MRCFFLAGAFASALSWHGSARADARECASAADQAQQLRDEGKYHRARERLLTCSREACPAPIRRDCAQWLSELDSTLPTIVVSAREGTRDLTAVKVSMDGAPLVDKLDGKPIAVDPGEHTLRYEQIGSDAIEQKIVVRAGEKNRILDVQFASKVRPPPPPPPHGAGESSPVAAYVLGGVGAAAIGGFAIFALMGKNEISDLRGTCAPNCAQADVDSAQSKILIANVSLAVGVVALGVATYLFVTRSKTEPPANVTNVRFDIEPLLGGGAATFGARF